MAWVKTSNGRTIEVDEDELRALIMQGGAEETDAPAPAATPIAVQPPTLNQALRPASTQAAGQGVGANLWAGTKDALTMPFRAAAGAGAAIGELGSSRNLGEAGKAFLSTMQSPSREASSYSPDVLPALSRLMMNPQVYAGMAESPLTGPGLALGGVAPGAGMIRAALGSGVGQGAALGAGSAAARKLDYLTGSNEDSRTVAAEDFIPVGAGAGISGIGKMIAATPRIRQGAAELIRRIVKPGVDEADILAGNDLMAKHGKFAEIVTPGTFGPGDIYNNFRRVLAEKGEATGREAAAADATGVKINMTRAAEDARRSVKAKFESGRLGLSEAERDAAIDWAKSKALVPRSAEMEQALAEANIPYKGSYVPVRRQQDIFAQVRGKPIMEQRGSGLAQAIGADMAPMYEAERALVGQKPALTGQFERLPDYYAPIPDIEYLPSTANNLKKAMQGEAYSGDPSPLVPRSGRKAAAQGLERAIRDQFEEVAPGLAKANTEAAPYYAADEYFSRANRRENNMLFTPRWVNQAAHIQLAKLRWAQANILDRIGAAQLRGRPILSPSLLGEGESQW